MIRVRFPDSGTRRFAILHDGQIDALRVTRQNEPILRR
jgi:hemin uptake protein HemP